MFESIHHLAIRGVAVEPMRIDEYTGKAFTFFSDPDGLPLELYEYGVSYPSRACQ